MDSPFTLHCTGFVCLRGTHRASTYRVPDLFAEMVLTLPSLGASYFVNDEK